ncbi:uncharacterized protein N7496_001329 [Penicillium cataractarum]|uniref:Uncharacterized protein n=1 Tax=Penicillium cataractarum TaxID=2100454 RepID=A0A9X0B6U4_9EURO|nr:uncharacterized protein N7496_001329 [Penicillium cataractarum]KAJ5390261.1 hypothetical protein N7496_001329 [Penicillium cataractarum]
MKFTGFTLSLALTGMISAAAIPGLPGADGVVGGVKGAAEGIVTDVAAGHLKRQLEAVRPVTEGVASSLNGGTGIVGSAVGTVESTGQGAVGTVESTVAGATHIKRQFADGDALNLLTYDDGTGKPTLKNVDNVAGLNLKRQFEVVQPVTEGVASSLNGGTGIVGSAVGTAESTGQGAVGTAESTVAGVGHVKRQLEAVQPVTEAVAGSLNGGTGIAGSAAGTVESTGQGAVGTVESTVAGVGSVAKRQLGNLPATASQTGTDLLAGLSGNPSGIYGALANLQMLIKAGKISPSDISNLPAAFQRIVANLAVA